MALRELPELDESTAATSPLHGRVVFVLGNGDSQAAVLEAALLAADGVVGPGVPSRLFSSGIGEVLASFALGAEPGRLGTGPAGDTGVSVLVGPQEVLASVRELTDAVLGTAGPGVVVEYSPEHASLGAVVSAVYPDALLVIVDDVAAAARSRAIHVTSSQIRADVSGVAAAVLSAAGSAGES